MTDEIGGLVFAQEPDAPDTINACIYGPPGAGKSTAAATAPGPVLWLNLEGPGALSFARKTARELDTLILEVRVSHGDDPRDAMREVIRYVREGADPAPRTVVVDTIGKLRDGLARAIGGSQPSLPQWGEVGRTIEDFVRIMRDLPVNFVLIAHEEIKDSDEGDRIVRPLIGGQATEKVITDMDVLAYAGVKRDEDGVHYLAQFVEARGRRAKDRSGGLGASALLDVSAWLAAYRAALTPTDDIFAADPGEAPDDGEPLGAGPVEIAL